MSGVEKAEGWPWHLKVTRTDGRVTENDYSDDFDAPRFAKWASTRDSVARVELSVTFVDGEVVDVAEKAKGSAS